MSDLTVEAERELILDMAKRTIAGERGAFRPEDWHPMSPEAIVRALTAPPFQDAVRMAYDALRDHGLDDAADALQSAALSAPAPQGIGREAVEAIVRDGLTNVPMIDASQSQILRIRTQQMTDRIIALLPTQPPAQGEG